MEGLGIRVAGPADLPALHEALGRLAAELGDPFPTTPEALGAACAGPCFGLVAGQAQGAALAAPVFSTLRGSAGVYLSDLWVDGALRGLGLGRALLAAAAREGAARWGAGFLKLTVYEGNAGAQAFYGRMGFRVQARDRACLLEGPAWEALSRDAQ